MASLAHTRSQCVPQIKQIKQRISSSIAYQEDPMHTQVQMSECVRDTNAHNGLFTQRSDTTALDAFEIFEDPKNYTSNLLHHILIALTLSCCGAKLPSVGCLGVVCTVRLPPLATLGELAVLPRALFSRLRLVVASILVGLRLHQHTWISSEPTSIHERSSPLFISKLQKPPRR